MKKIVIGILLFITGLDVLFAQNVNEDKYWYYRYRLRKYFMKAGFEGEVCKVPRLKEQY